jgi:HK97 family phage prohead protease
VRPREVMSWAPEVAKLDTRGRLMVGYASAFDRPIPMGPRLTAFMRPGAFTKTLSEQAAQVQVTFNHGRDPRYGMLPIGVPQVMRPEAYGLWTETLLHDGPDNDNLKAALASHSLRSMSVMFEAMRSHITMTRQSATSSRCSCSSTGP